MYRSTFFLVGLVVFVGDRDGVITAQTAPSTGESPPAPGIHREVPGDPYLPTPPQPPRSQRGKTRWARGPYVSVQVNVDEFGDNIVGDAANEPSIAIDPTNPNLRSQKPCPRR